MDNTSLGATLGPPVVGVEPAIVTKGGTNPVEMEENVPAGTDLAAEVVPGGNAVLGTVGSDTDIGHTPVLAPYALKYDPGNYSRCFSIPTYGY